jgi:predicted nucleic acid-binding protein
MFLLDTNVISELRRTAKADRNEQVTAAPCLWCSDVRA